MTFVSFLVSGLLLGGIYGLFAVPLALVWKSTAMLDFAVGAYVVAAGIVAAIVGWPWAVPAALATGVALSAVTALLYLLFQATQRASDHMAMSMGTFGIAIAVTAGIVTWLGTDAHFLRTSFTSIRLGEVVIQEAYLVALGVAVAMLLATLLVLYRTSLGLQMRASAMASDHAELSGIRVRRIQFSVFVAGGLMAGVAGLMVTMTAGLSYASSTPFSIVALSGAVLLGLRGPGTAFLGGLVLGVAESLSFAYFNQFVSTVLPSLVILVVLIVGGFDRRAASLGRP
jgi:branched-chain amino acid transport system permease protein